jgi:hypothetical protein
VKAQAKVGPNLIVELEAAKQKDLFKALASAHEVFGEKECGLCKSKEIVPVWRTVTVVKGKKQETFEFPEYHCQNQQCRARLSMGTMNDDSGTIYPKRKLLANGKPPGKDDGDQATYGTHRGWTKYRGPAGEGE